MNIALTAPTGKIGAAVLAAAHERKIPVRALVRDAARLPRPASIAEHFDFANPATYATAFAGIETLLFISPAGPAQAAIDKTVIDAARAAGVAHVIKLSAAGADAGTTRFLAHHRAVEEHLRARAAGWTMVRPTFFMGNVLTRAAAIANGTYPAPTADGRMTQIAASDIADVLLTVAVEPARHREAIYTLTAGAADRGEQIAAILAEAAGHAVRYADVPEEAFRQNALNAGIDPWIADGMCEGFAKVRAGGAEAITGDVKRVTGREPIAFASWARSHAGAWRK